MITKLISSLISLPENSLVAIDFSGSNELEKNWKDIHQVLSNLAPQTKFCLFDTQVHKVFNSLSEVSDSLASGICGGGTQVEPVLKLAQEIKVSHICFVTDGYFPTPTFPSNLSYSWILSAFEPDFKSLPGNKYLII